MPKFRSHASSEIHCVIYGVNAYSCAYKDICTGYAVSLSHHRHYPVPLTLLS